MMQTVREALDQRDLLVLVADASRFFGRRTARRDLVRKGQTRVLAVNKIRPRWQTARAAAPSSTTASSRFRGVRAAFARRRRVVECARYCRAAAVRRPTFRKIPSPTSGALSGGELMREKILRETRKEVPTRAVLVDRWEDTRGFSRV